MEMEIVFASYGYLGFSIALDEFMLVPVRASRVESVADLFYYKKDGLFMLYSFGESIVELTWTVCFDNLFSRFNSSQILLNSLSFRSI